MSEELNQVQDENVFSDETEEENLFDDVEETETADESVKETETEETPQSFLKVKYNGEERDLNEEDARTYVQKGMNYDKVYEVYKPIEQLARMNNMSVSDYVNQLNNTQYQYEVSLEVDRLRQDPKYADVSDEILEEIAGNHVTENQNLQYRQEEENQRAQEDAQQEKIKRDVDLFLKEYPQFAGEGQKNLDNKVFDYVREGYTLLEAYEKFQRESTQAKVAKQNEENRRRSLGNTTNASKVETDDFLKGFLNG